jgi:hypothetical protein
MKDKPGFYEGLRQVIERHKQESDSVTLDDQTLTFTHPASQVVYTAGIQEVIDWCYLQRTDDDDKFDYFVAYIFGFFCEQFLSSRNLEFLEIEREFMCGSSATWLWKTRRYRLGAYDKGRIGFEIELQADDSNFCLSGSYQFPKFPRMRQIQDSIEEFDRDFTRHVMFLGYLQSEGITFQHHHDRIILKPFRITFIRGKVCYEIQEADNKFGIPIIKAQTFDSEAMKRVILLVDDFLAELQNSSLDVPVVSEGITITGIFQD